MQRIMLKSKINGAHVTKTLLHYKGSIGIDEALMESANILENEQVHVLNFNNGERFETYVIKEERNSGTICLYGPAALKGKQEDKIIILSYAVMDDDESKKFKPDFIVVDHENKIKNDEE